MMQRGPKVCTLINAYNANGPINLLRGNGEISRTGMRTDAITGCPSPLPGDGLTVLPLGTADLCELYIL